MSKRPYPSPSSVEAIVVPGVLADPLLAVRRLTKHFPLRTGLFGRTTGQVRAGGDAEGRRLGQGVAQDALQQQAGKAERCAGKQRDCGAR